jgi:hypothetical protein
MPAQASHLLRLPVELRLIIYGYIFNEPRQATLQHSLTCVSELISEEVLPILLSRFAFFFWTAIPCNEEWYLAFDQRQRVVCGHGTLAANKNKLLPARRPSSMHRSSSLRPTGKELSTLTIHPWMPLSIADT